MVIGGHFGGGDHFDGGDHFGGGTDVKDVMKTESCMRIALYQHFQEDPTCKDPGHLCCTVCREKCKCTGDGCAVGEVYHLSAPQDTEQSSSP